MAITNTRAAFDDPSGVSFAYRRLACAILLQAIDDLYSSNALEAFDAALWLSSSGGGGDLAVELGIDCDDLLPQILEAENVKFLRKTSSNSKYAGRGVIRFDASPDSPVYDDPEQGRIPGGDPGASRQRAARGGAK